MPIHAKQDPHNLKWTAVTAVEPRSRRITSESGEETLTAPRRADAIENVRNTYSYPERSDEHFAEPVLKVDVAHILAHREVDEEAPYLEMDEEETMIKKDDDINDYEADTERPELDPGIWDFV
ncbi:hypothetical protein KC19_VG186900 [Ceratodon purpureus]|uniref:Uncharacterized protein n=1 Tax=Ceratodon purpureus TaxID=3225 RepID=A0A8T0HSL3_CERPU|nr:hypothetical protein KC19_VG186900 [Ceratodon purpureus]